MASRADQLADAYEAVARADHYMVGIVEPVTADERDEAREILITRQNTYNPRGKTWKRLDLALDMLDRDIAIRE